MRKTTDWSHQDYKFISIRLCVFEKFKNTKKN